ncbi:MAG: hypothetical protein EHM88_16085 [Candidatus Rokuibacteriota bacterium]|nr:MAG: hypothetical protein EHM88_16085 [Candidatus Rokubacteria bacterium]
MRSRARCVLVVAATLLSLVSGVVPAQEKPDATMEVLREKVRADKKLVVALALDLSESEATGFWPVYGAYQSDMVAHYDRVAKLISDYATAYQKMTDETATQLLGEFLALQSDHAALLQRYVPRFQRVLPPRKVARFYQVENKIRAMVDYELAREIPLIK